MRYDNEHQRAPKFILIWVLILVGFLAGASAMILAATK
jgi:hypothetical protein